MGDSYRQNCVDIGHIIYPISQYDKLIWTKWALTDIIHSYHFHTVVFDIEKGKETVQFKSILNVFNALNIGITLNSPLMDKYKEHENS